MTLKQNQEYVIAGLSTQIGTPFLYEGGTLVAVVGQGGQTGRFNKGGDGGSFNSDGSVVVEDQVLEMVVPYWHCGNGTFGSIMNEFVNASTVASMVIVLRLEQMVDEQLHVQKVFIGTTRESMLVKV